MGELLVCRQIQFYFIWENCISSNHTSFNYYFKMYRFLKKRSGRVEGAHYCFCFILPAVFWMQSHFLVFQYALSQGNIWLSLNTAHLWSWPAMKEQSPGWWKAGEKVSETNSHQDTTCALGNCSQPGQQEANRKMWCRWARWLQNKINKLLQEGEKQNA